MRSVADETYFPFLLEDQVIKGIHLESLNLTMEILNILLHFVKHN